MRYQIKFYWSASNKTKFTVYGDNNIMVTTSVRTNARTRRTDSSKPQRLCRHWSVEKAEKCYRTNSGRFCIWTRNIHSWKLLGWAHRLQAEHPTWSSAALKQVQHKVFTTHLYSIFTYNSRICILLLLLCLLLGVNQLSQSYTQQPGQSTKNDRTVHKSTEITPLLRWPSVLDFPGQSLFLTCPGKQSQFSRDVSLSRFWLGVPILPSLQLWQTISSDFICIIAADRGSTPDPAGAAYDAPPDPQVGPPMARSCGAHTLQFAPSALLVPDCNAQIMVASLLYVQPTFNY